MTVGDRLAGFAAFLTGLAAFRARDLSLAERWFGEAARMRAWQGAGLVQLFLGNTLGKLGRLRDAVRAYNGALRIVPGWPRPRLGLTEIALHRAQRGCGLRASRKELRFVQYQFALLIQPGDDLVHRATRIRAMLGEARADLCLAQVLPSRLETARRELRAVIAAIGADTRRFGAEAAEAHGGLGLVDLAAPADLRAAQGEYQRAAALTDDARRQYFFNGMVTTIKRKVGS
jgi:tetratricopeptide (TPR) repeat protein